MRLVSEGGLKDISYATLCFLEQKEDQQRKDQENSTEVKEQQWGFFLVRSKSFLSWKWQNALHQETIYWVTSSDSLMYLLPKNVHSSPPPE